MSGVWVFKNGVYRLVENPNNSADRRQKVLVYVPTNEVIDSYGKLAQKLKVHGWERYRPRVDQGLLQFHKQSSLDLISLPVKFADMGSVHMFDIVVKCRDVFEVRDVVARTA